MKIKIKRKRELDSFLFQGEINLKHLKIISHPSGESAFKTNNNTYNLNLVKNVNGLYLYRMFPTTKHQHCIWKFQPVLTVLNVNNQKQKVMICNLTFYFHNYLETPSTTPEIRILR